MLNVNQSASKMDILIDSLLKYSTISRRKLKKTTFSLNTLVNSVISNLKLDKSKKIQWKFTEMPVIYADKFLLTILFKEIFINSIKFSKPDKTVTITIESNKTKQGTIINVKDEGIGVQFKYQEKAFLLFHQLDTKDYANGIGAGLAYARKIIERHQGTICFTADSDNGATLCMFFPDTYE